MSELEKQYEGRIDFEVVMPEVAEDGSLIYARQSPHVETHGLEVLDAEGQLVDSIDGHNFGKPEIEAIIAKLLGEGG